MKFKDYLETARSTDRYKQMLDINDGDVEAADTAAMIDYLLSLLHNVFDMDNSTVAAQVSIAVGRTSLALVAKHDPFLLMEHTASMSMEACQIFIHARAIEKAKREQAISAALRQLKASGKPVDELFLLNADGEAINAAEFMQQTVKN